MTQTTTCPIAPSLEQSRDVRESAALADAEARPLPGFAPIVDFNLARDPLRSEAMQRIPHLVRRGTQ